MKKMLIGGALAALLVSLVIPAGAVADDLSANATYKTKCAGCHGANGEGKAALKTAPLSDSAKKSDAELTEAITKGKGKMPGYSGKLKDAEIAELVKEIKALKK